MNAIAQPRAPIRTYGRKGRPQTQPWEQLKPEIELLVRSGFGVKLLAKHYGITPAGMRAVLKRLGIRTQWQREVRADEH